MWWRKVTHFNGCRLKKWLEYVARTNECAIILCFISFRRCFCGFLHLCASFSPAIRFNYVYTHKIMNDSTDICHSNVPRTTGCLFESFSTYEIRHKYVKKQQKRQILKFKYTLRSIKKIEYRKWRRNKKKFGLKNRKRILFFFSSEKKWIFDYAQNHPKSKASQPDKKSVVERWS